MKNTRMKATLSLSIAMALAVPFVVSMIFCNSLALASQKQPRQVDEKADATKIEKYRYSGPYAYKNLAVFLIHAKDGKDTAKFMTLQQGLEHKKAVVSETGTVNTLVIENVSDDVHIYIQSGDIVRGGKQDRTIGYDYVVPPKSGKIQLSSFCVESGRWRRRGHEKVDEFSVSDNALPSKGLKLASNYNRSQSSVWQEVASIQDKLSHNLGKSVRSEQSASSLELTLENEEVKKAIQEYVDAFSHLVQGRKDAVGCAFAINGKLNSADVYASGDLFRRLWPKLLQASSIEAIAELQKTSAFVHPAVHSVETFLQNDEEAKIHEKQIDEQLRAITRRSKNKVVFETYKAGEQKPLHKSYIHVDPNSLRQESQPMQNSQTRLNIRSLNQQQDQHSSRRSEP